MLPHPLRLRSVCQASVSTIFACGHVALRYVRGIAKFLSSAGSVTQRACVFSFRAGLARSARPFPRKTKSPLVSGPSSNFAILENLERAKGLEPSTPTLARSDRGTPSLNYANQKGRLEPGFAGISRRVPLPSPITANHGLSAFRVPRRSLCPAFALPLPTLP
jgi:hypothetical protein